MKIAVFHDLPSGGAKRALCQQITGLRERGFNVDLFLPATAEDTLFPTVQLADRATVFPRPTPPDRERALERGFSPGLLLGWLAYLARVRAGERAIAAAIDEGGYDVVLVHPNQVTQAPFLLGYLRTPTVYYCHEPLRAAYESRIVRKPFQLAIRQTLGRLDRIHARAATVIAVNSRFSARRIEALYGRQVRVNYLGVDVDRFRPRALPEERYVLTVGALHPLKGLDFLVDAVGRVHPTVRPPLWIVSDRARVAERRRLEERAMERGVDLRFAFQVAEDELATLYSRARVVLYAPHDEPFGFVPLEAMACARPVLAVPEGGISETVVESETGFLAPRDVAQFGAVLSRLLAEPDRAEAVARNAARIVRERWRWDRSITELAVLCQEAVDQRRGPAGEVHR